METRRETLKIIGAVGTTCAFPFAADELYGQTVPAAVHEHDHPGAVPPAPAGPYTAKFFTVPEMAVVSRVSDLIIPPTDTPGAVAAGVPKYIDGVVSANANHQKLYRDGIAFLDSEATAKFGKKFVEIGEDQQIVLLTPLSEAAFRGDTKGAGESFFHAIKSMTADGYYTSYAGLVQELGYKGNTALASFPGCTHQH